jgi:hypothetical protein
LIKQSHEIFYIDRLLHHTNSIVNKIDEFNLKQNALIEKSKSKSKDHQRSVEELLEILMEVMGHIAALSRYFWPIDKNEPHKGRGQRLRDVYAINENNPLKIRHVRNAVEHFDEVLDKLLATSPTNDILPSYIGSRKKLEERSAICFIGYLVDEQVIKVLDVEARIPDVLSEVGRIQAVLKTQVSNGLKF